VENDTSRSGRQINAGEANRLAQELNRQVTPDIPAYTADETAQSGDSERQDTPSDNDRESPDRALEESSFPPDIQGDATIGGSEDERRILRLEEER
jgi:hypothetical protein